MNGGSTSEVRRKPTYRTAALGSGHSVGARPKRTGRRDGPFWERGYVVVPVPGPGATSLLAQRQSFERTAPPRLLTPTGLRAAAGVDGSALSETPQPQYQERDMCGQIVGGVGTNREPRELVDARQAIADRVLVDAECQRSVAHASGAVEEDRQRVQEITLRVVLEAKQGPERIIGEALRLRATRRG